MNTHLNDLTSDLVTALAGGQSTGRIIAAIADALPDGHGIGSARGELPELEHAGAGHGD